MKRYLNIALSIVLSFAMIFALAACGDKNKPDKKGNDSSSQSDDASNVTISSNALIGNWKGEVAEIYDDYSEMKYGVEMTFKDDNTYVIKINAEEMVRAEVFVEKKHYSNGTYTFDDYLRDSGYGSEEEYIQARVKKFDPKNLTIEGEYYFDGSKFLMDGIKMGHEFNDGKFKYFDDDGSVTLEKA